MEETLHADRAISIDSAENIRDLGGYSTREGVKTKWGRFVRSGDMDHLTVADQRKLIAYGITTVIDLRMVKEVEAMPNVFFESRDVNFLVHDFWGDRFDTYRSTSKGAPPAVKLADLYCSGLIKSGFVMARIMSTIADTPENGFAYHCRSGKDRTGLVSMMLLAIAGVPDEMICADFALTSAYLSSPEADPNQPGFYLKGCDPETMGLTLGFLTENFESVEGYLQHIGVTEQQVIRIRQKLLD
ncbi:MAG: tyrosine-protein phosphatase [bacterium]|nr:tyrosine-protein phosphatase [Gammaproteobacteria bacterium]HIL96376.1 tyrosine-protein phosphatase [Pseudomonadales bacterium]